MLPKSRPQIGREEAEGLLNQKLFPPLNRASNETVRQYSVALLGVRGYYLDSLGEAGNNDRGIYDDAICLISPEMFVTFNANTDPSVARNGIAVLEPGRWLYRLGIHGLSKPIAKQYEALVQAAHVTVMRDGVGEDTGMFGINIHRGSRVTTSSLGCQTIHPSQWKQFITLVKEQLKKFSQTKIPYVLITEEERRMI